MKCETKRITPRQVLACEWLGFSLVIFFIWIDEILDMPHLFFGAQATPINWTEAIFETIVITMIGVITIYLTHKLVQRILEGILPICASCKKIKDEKGDWQAVESFMRAKSGVLFSHGICPECMEKLYPDLLEEESDRRF